MIYINIFLTAIIIGFAFHAYANLSWFACFVIGFFSIGIIYRLISYKKLRNIFFLIFGIANGSLLSVFALEILDMTLFKDSTTKASNSVGIIVAVFAIFIIIMFFVNKSAADSNYQLNGQELEAEKIHKAFVKTDRARRKEKARLEREQEKKAKQEIYEMKHGINLEKYIRPVETEDTTVDEAEAVMKTETNWDRL